MGRIPDPWRVADARFEVAQSTVSKYMVRGGTPPSQNWKTFLRNHAQAIAAIDLCVVPTLTFDRLFAFLVLGHGRRQLLWFQVTRCLHPPRHDPHHAEAPRCKLFVMNRNFADLNGST